MIAYILFIMIGVKLNMLHGWYLGLTIVGIVLKLISLCVELVKAGMKVNE